MRFDSRPLLICFLTAWHFSVAWPASLSAQSAPSPQTELRVFRVKLEDKDVGTYQQQITAYGEGTIDVAVESRVKVKALGVMVHQFAYRGHERWKDNRLIYLASASNDNGTPHTLVVTAEASGLKVKDNGKERQVGGSPWSTSYWNMPPDTLRQQTMLYLDADAGAEYHLAWRLVGKETLSVGQQRVAVSHFKLTGEVELELWFDEKGRLVRREMLRKGRKTVMELMSVTVK